MSQDKGVDSAYVAFAMAVRRLELRYGIFIHASPEWIYLSRVRPSSNMGVFTAVGPPSLAAELEREVDAEPHRRVRPS